MGKKRKQKAQRGRMIYEAGLYPLQETSGEYSIFYYYFFKSTNRERILGRLYQDLPGYDILKDRLADFVFGGPKFDNILDEADQPSRYKGFFRDRELNLFYVIRVIPKSYLPTLWVHFYKPISFGRAQEIVDKLMPKAIRTARKYAKEDGFIN